MTSGCGFAFALCLAVVCLWVVAYLVMYLLSCGVYGGLYKCFCKGLFYVCYALFGLSVNSVVY